MNVKIVSPLHPARTGVADYALTLSRGLARLMQVELVATLSKDTTSDEDVYLYHIGNNSLHAAAYSSALQQPGVVVLHDAVLNHFFLGQLGKRSYVDEFVHNYGEWMRQFAEQLWEDRASASCDARYFRYPMLRRIVERSRAVIVHNPKAAKLAQDVMPKEASVPIVEIPHFVEEPKLPDDAERVAIRKRLGVPLDAVVIGSFGDQRPTKRLNSLLQAVKNISVPYRLLLVGEFVSTSYEKAVKPLMESLPTICRSYVSEREFWDLASITDICVNLRNPSAGETSGIVMKLAAAGTPVIVTDGEESARYPSNSFWKVDAGEMEIAMLSEMLRVLTKDQLLRSTVGAEARRYIVDNHTLPGVVKLYQKALQMA